MVNFPFPKTATSLNVKEVAALFRVDPKTVRRWIMAGELPATRLGCDWRIAVSDLKAHAARRGNGPLAHVL